jgi:hypothetical protein
MPSADPGPLEGTAIAGSKSEHMKDSSMMNETDAAEDPGSTADVAVSDQASLARWSEALGVTPQALEGAVHAVGTRVDRIKDYLTGGMAGDQEDA